MCVVRSVCVTSNDIAAALLQSVTNPVCFGDAVNNCFSGNSEDGKSVRLC